MNAGILFGIIALIVVIILFWPAAKAKKEGFKPVPAQPAPLPAAAPDATLGADRMPAAPYIGGNSQAPRPFTDPALTKASLYQLQNLAEDLKGFQAYELPQLQDRADPAIQLPLQNIQADTKRVQDEVSVLSRNPGIQSQLTLQDVESIRANLSYLQRKNRVLSGVGLTSSVVEGFDGSAGSQAPVATNFKIYNYTSNSALFSNTAASEPGFTSTVFNALAGVLQTQAQEVASKYNISKTYTVAYVDPNSNSNPSVTMSGSLSRTTNFTSAMILSVLNNTSITSADVPILIVPRQSFQSNALGYHSIATNSSGDPISFIVIDLTTIIDSSSTTNPAKDLFTKTISHEIIEVIGDPYTNVYAQNELNGIMYFKELCDPVQELSYVQSTFTLSDYVYPSWFQASGAEPFHKYGEQTSPTPASSKKITAPFQLKLGNGYILGKYMGKRGMINGMGSSANIYKFVFDDGSTPLIITPIRDEQINSAIDRLNNLSVPDANKAELAADIVRLNTMKNIPDSDTQREKRMGRNILAEMIAYYENLAKGSGSSGSSSGSSQDNNETPTPATKAELTDLVAKLTAEIARLSASGTTDSVVQARISVLNRIKGDVQAVIDKVDNGDIEEKDITITSQEVSKTLTFIKNPNLPLSQLVEDTPGVPAWLKYFVPDLKDDTIKKFLDGFSWAVSMDYTSKNKALAGSCGAPVNQSCKGAGSSDESDDSWKSSWDISGSDGSWPGPNYSSDSASADSLFGLAPASKPAGKFDWKGRTQHICQQISASGFEPSDFGCLPADAVGADFNWRGQAKRVCSRAATHADPGFPESLGCPAPDWAGWSKA